MDSYFLIDYIVTNNHFINNHWIPLIIPIDSFPNSFPINSHLIIIFWLFMKSLENYVPVNFPKSPWRLTNAQTWTEVDEAVHKAFQRGTNHQRGIFHSSFPTCHVWESDGNKNTLWWANRTNCGKSSSFPGKSINYL